MTLETLAGRLPRAWSCNLDDLRILAESLVATGWLRRTTVSGRGLAPEPARGSGPQGDPHEENPERFAYERTQEYERTQDMSEPKMGGWRSQRLSMSRYTLGPAVTFAKKRRHASRRCCAGWEQRCTKST